MEEAAGSGRYPQQSSTFGLWEMLKMRRPQKWDVLNKLLTQSTTEIPTSTTPLSWNVNESSRLQNQDTALPVQEINSLAAAQEPSTTTMTSRPDTDREQQSQSAEDSGSIQHSSPAQSDKPHQLASWLVVRIDDSTCYAATASFDNGTIVFQRFGTDGLNPSGWRNLSHIEAYYPGFGKAAGSKPSRLLVQVAIHTADADETLNKMEGTPQTVVMGNQTVFIPSNSPWAGSNETIMFDVATFSEKQNGTDAEIVEMQSVVNDTKVVITKEEGSDQMEDNIQEEISSKNQTDIKQEPEQIENQTDIPNQETMAVTFKSRNDTEFASHEIIMEEESKQSSNNTTEEGSDSTENRTEISNQTAEQVKNRNDTTMTEEMELPVKNQNYSATQDTNLVEKVLAQNLNDTDMSDQEMTTEGGSFDIESTTTEIVGEYFTTEDSTTAQTDAEMTGQNVTMEDTPSHEGSVPETWNAGFRRVEDEEPEENDVDELDRLQQAVNLAVPVVVSNVTDVPSSSTEEQVAPPLLKNLENLLLTHLLTSSMAPSTTSAVSTTTSPSSTSLRHSPPVDPIDDWAIFSQLIQQKPARKPLTSSPPTPSKAPEAIAQSPAHYDPSRNEAMWSSHSVIIPSRTNSILQLSASSPLRGVVRPEFVGHTTDQLSLMAVSEKPPISSTPSTLPTSPIEMFTLRPESSAASLAGPVTSQQSPPKKKSGGLASLILAHTSALMSGKNSPFFNAHRYNPNNKNNSISRSEDRQTKKNSMAANVHVITALSFPDPEQEEEMRHRSVDSRPTKTQVANSSNWAFPSFTQLIESPELILPAADLQLSVPIAEDRPSATQPISSYNGGGPVGDLPQLPRKNIILTKSCFFITSVSILTGFTCGQQTTADELVLTNPSYPQPDDHAGRCGFRLLVISHHVCQVG